MTENAHHGKTVTCFHEDQPHLHHSVDLDDTDEDATTLTFEEHGRYLGSLAGRDDFGKSLRERFEAAALRFDCPDCGRRYFVCPVCSEPDDSSDNSPAGWYRGESTGEQLACHNCNQAEYARQMREPF